MSNHCKDCPMYQDTMASMQAVDCGCLPNYYEAREMYNQGKGLWACHCNTKIACRGFVGMMESNNLELNKNNELITEL